MRSAAVFDGSAGSQGGAAESEGEDGADESLHVSLLVWKTALRLPENKMKGAFVKVRAICTPRNIPICTMSSLLGAALTKKRSVFIWSGVVNSAALTRNVPPYAHAQLARTPLSSSHIVALAASSGLPSKKPCT